MADEKEEWIRKESTRKTNRTPRRLDANTKQVAGQRAKSQRAWRTEREEASEQHQAWNDSRRKRKGEGENRSAQADQKMRRLKATGSSMQKDAVKVS